jgi:cytochrome c biogenesis protein CcdA
MTSMKCRRGLHWSLAALLGLAFWLAALAPVQADGVVHGFYFYSPDCSHCQAVAKEVLPEVQARFGSQLELRMFDIREPQNNAVLLALEARYGLQEVGLPEAFIGPDVLVGEEAIRSGLAALVEKHLAAGGADYPTADVPVLAATPTAETTGGPLIHMAYFYKAGCSECERVTYDLELIRSRYPNVSIERFDIAESQALDWALAKRAGLPESKRLLTPAVFVGDDALVGSEVTVARLEELVARYQVAGAEPVWEGISTEEASRDIVGFFRSLGPLAVAGAGLVDGLNPCAFATIVFFISYLAFAGRSRRYMILVGSAFTLGVFVTYLLVGLGALRFAAAVSGVRAVGWVVYGLMAVACLAFAGVSAHDAVQARRGKPEAMQLRLPRFLQRRVHAVIRRNSSGSTFAGVAAVTGVVVSLLELACTGQVYLPTILYVQGEAQLRASAVSYLLLYNLLFVVPLIVVFVVAAFGVSSARLAGVVQKHTATIKGLTAVVFAVLGLYLLTTLL